MNWTDFAAAVSTMVAFLSFFGGLIAMIAVSDRSYWDQLRVIYLVAGIWLWLLCAALVGVAVGLG